LLPGGDQGPQTARWLTAEARGHDLEAEAAFALLWRSVPREAAASGLEARIWRATRRARLSRKLLSLLRSSAAAAALLGLSGLVLYVAAGVLTALAGRLVTGSIMWLMRGFVWVTIAFTEGLDTWSLLARVGGAVSAAIVTPRATTALILTELVGAMAFYVLNRVLAREKKEIRS